jgi:tRNA pseudouridine55 synthase
MDQTRDFDFQNGEILLIDKPRGWSSFDVVRKLKRGVNAKIGHAGTLDPLASGLMILATGPFTKRISEFQDMTKEYTGTIFLGATTPSFDRETEPEDIIDISAITEEGINNAAKTFVGKILQVPPAFSAIKIDGKRSYKLARKGKAPEMKARELEIHEFEITGIELPLVYFRVVCSKGTYIRSLAHDFGKLLGVGAYLYDLCRTKIGDFKLEDAWPVDELSRHILDISNAKEGDADIS